MSTIYEWEFLEVEDGELSDNVFHLDMKDIDSVVIFIKHGHYVKVLKQFINQNLGSGDREYYDIFTRDEWGRVDETDKLPKYIQKYVHKVKERLSQGRKCSENKYID